MPLYESVFIARQDISASQVDSLADQFAGVIQAGGGEVKKREYWGLRNLAFRIKKNRKGHYMLFNIDAPAPAVAEMERNMRINEDIVRFLTVRVDELEADPSAMMRSRGGRDERGGRRPGGRYGPPSGDGGPRGGRAPRDGAPRDGASRDSAPRDSAPKESSPRESAPEENPSTEGGST